MKRRREEIRRRKRRRNIFLSIIAILVFSFIFLSNHKNKKEEIYQKSEVSEIKQTENEEQYKETQNESTISVIQKMPEAKEIQQDWQIRIANYNHILPEDFSVELANIDKDRKFDARAIDKLNEMMNDIKKEGITNIWIQSSYRSIEEQTTLYNQHIQKYINQGKTQEEAEKLTLEYLNKPGASDHNLGLAVDFNYVDNTFEQTTAFKWLTEHAEEYGFILRYPKGKQEITKINYESWHWRYVGEEHAKRINELGMCLEEYVEYLENGVKGV